LFPWGHCFQAGVIMPSIPLRGETPVRRRSSNPWSAYRRLDCPLGILERNGCGKACWTSKSYFDDHLEARCGVASNSRKRNQSEKQSSDLTFHDSNNEEKHMNSYIYVDNSNLFVQGRYKAAVEQGLASSITEAQRLNIQDSSWQINYSRLYQLLCGTSDDENAACRLWGSSPPGEWFWKMIQSFGFECNIVPRSIAGREKKVDVSIATAIIADSFTIIDQTDSEITLVTGDIDFVPVVEILVSRGFNVCVAFWGEAGNELRETASSFFNLDPFFDYLTFTPVSGTNRRARQSSAGAVRLVEELRIH
jgi:uncharacterized LabA/DUF88 family protein